MACLDFLRLKKNVKTYFFFRLIAKKYHVAVLPEFLYVSDFNHINCQVTTNYLNIPFYMDQMHTIYS